MQQRHVGDAGEGHARLPRAGQVVDQREGVLDPGEQGVDERQQVHVQGRGAGGEQRTVQLDHRPVPHLPVGLGAGDLRGLLLEERRGPVGDDPGDELVVQRLVHGAVGEGALQGGVLGERLGDREESLLVHDVALDPGPGQPEGAEQRRRGQQQDGEQITQGGHQDTVPPCLSPVAVSSPTHDDGPVAPERGATGPSRGRVVQPPMRMKVQLPE
ncbi:MAG: hypothetical protein LOY01_08770 [Brachybacterium paraconglomeratum]|nr:hypothetical protein [Brachybacterium paraconglomeratum]